MNRSLFFFSSRRCRPAQIHRNKQVHTKRKTKNEQQKRKRKKSDKPHENTVSLLKVLQGQLYPRLREIGALPKNKHLRLGIGHHQHLS